jgi:hypothetical protein
MTQDSMPTGLEGPGPRRPQAHLAWLLRLQADGCAHMGSRLYGALLGAAADDVEAGGPAWAVLADHVAPGRADALALRLMAAVHRLVLLRQAPALALHYPSVGGTAADPDAACEAFLDLLAARTADVRERVALPCQTNEVGRTAALVGGFLDTAAATGLPLRILELGASAGLNLRWDRFRYGGGGATWGPAGSPVDLTGLWRIPPPVPDAAVEVVERRGCDLAPVDPTSPEGRLSLSASVWADQPHRFARLRGGLAVAADVPAPVDRASVHDWARGQLADPPSGCATVVFHSIVEEYLGGAVRRDLHAAIAEAGARATARTPLAWLRLEPVTALREHAVTLTTWPGGRARELARCGAHGDGVVWAPSAT